MKQSLFFPALLGVACLIPGLVSAVSVSTAVGNGADAQINEQNDSGSNGTQLNTRTSASNNEIIALRFDLSGYTLAELANVSLSVTAFRNDGSARQVALYGVAYDAVPSSGSFTAEDWAEASVKFSTMPGLLAPDADTTTQSLNSAKVIALGQLTYATNSKGATETFSDPAITSFIQGYAGSKVTFLLAAAPVYTSTGQGRIASKEATSLDGGDPTGAAGSFAPSLNFTPVPEPTSLALGALGTVALFAARRRL